jgi:negative regulator of flagellin synthesis FlgM
VKIDTPSPLPGQNPTSSSVNQVAQTKAVQANIQQATENVTTQADVQVTSFASQLKDVGATLNGSPVVNAKKVAEIKQAIAEGQFSIDPEKIADSLLDDVRQALGNSNSKSSQG